MNNLREHDRGDGGLHQFTNTGHMLSAGRPEKSKKRFNVGLSHVARVLCAVKLDEVIDPRQISLFGPAAIVQASILRVSLIQKPG